MLILDRRKSERVRLKMPDGRELWVMVVGFKPGKVRLGFTAPDDVQVQREEVIDDHAAGTGGAGGG